MKKSRIAYAVILLLVVFLDPSNISGQIEKKTLEESIKSTDLIIVGEVQSVESKWDQKRSHIWTYVTVSVDECIKGSNISRNIVVKVPGGIIKEEGIIQEFEYSPIFRKDEKVLLMLRFLPDIEQYAIVNSAFGKFSITDTNRIIGEGLSKDELIKKIKNIILKENH